MMSRINVVPVSELYDRHLVAEYKEIPRVLGVALRAELRGVTPETYGIPEKYCLNKGHVKFITNKLEFVFKRFSELVEEMILRGFKPKYLTLEGLPAPTNKAWFGGYEPMEEAISLNRERIALRVSENPKLYKKTKYKGDTNEIN